MKPSRMTGFAVVMMLMLTALPLLSEGTGTSNRVNVTGNQSPLYFTANRGQVHEAARFYARTRGYTLWLTASGLVFDRVQGSTREVNRLLFLNPDKETEILPQAPSTSKVNLFKGNDRGKWFKNLPVSEAVLYKNVYDGIHLKVYGKESRIEYDWQLQPGADPGKINFQFTNVRKSLIDETGNLVLTTARGSFTHCKPTAFQEIDGKRVPVAVRFESHGGAEKHVYRFHLGPYQKNHPLVIDPVVAAFSTYLGGTGYDQFNDVTVDASGFVYVTGETASTDYPVQDHVQVYTGSMDVLVSKIDPTQAGLAGVVYSTYIGGTGDESGQAVAVDAGGMIYVAGYTLSGDFPQVNQIQGYMGGEDVFLVKLDPGQSGPASLLYATYLGGASNERAVDIAAGGGGIVYFTGHTEGPDFPLFNAYQSDQPLDDGFVTQVDTTVAGGAGLLYSTYLGGDYYDYCLAIDVDAAGAVYVTGSTGSSDFPIMSAYQPMLQGFRDSFVSKLDPALGASGMLYSTYLGGTDEDNCYGLDADDGGIVYLACNTYSTDFPTVNPYQTDPGDNDHDGVVVKLDTGISGSGAMLYGTYLGGSGWDALWDIAADGGGNVCVVGNSWSTDFPLLNQYQDDPETSFDDVVVVKLDPAQTGAAGMIYSTYLGGGDYDLGAGIALDAGGNAVITGTTHSTDFPTVNPTMGMQGNGDGFITRLEFGIPPGSITVTAPNGGESWKFGSTKTITWDTAGVTNDVKITLWQNGVKIGAIVNNLPFSPGTFDWTVGTYNGGTVLPGSGYTVKVKEKGLPVKDFSDAPFNIARITVTAPNGGETLTIGSTANITWSAEAVTANLKITLWQNGVKLGVIANNLPPGTGSFAWTVGNHNGGPAAAGTGFKIKVKEKGAAVADKSDTTFELVN